jgi:hypothetical protein
MIEAKATPKLIGKFINIEKIRPDLIRSSKTGLIFNQPFAKPKLWFCERVWQVSSDVHDLGCANSLGTFHQDQSH